MSEDSLSPLYHWGFYARWWDCVRERMDIETGLGKLPLFERQWSYVDLYEVECGCIARTQDDALKIFNHRYPWIENFHVWKGKEVKKKLKRIQRRRRLK